MYIYLYSPYNFTGYSDAENPLQIKKAQETAEVILCVFMSLCLTTTKLIKINKY